MNRFPDAIVMMRCCRLNIYKVASLVRALSYVAPFVVLSWFFHYIVDRVDVDRVSRSCCVAVMVDGRDMISRFSSTQQKILFFLTRVDVSTVTRASPATAAKIANLDSHNKQQQPKQQQTSSSSVLSVNLSLLIERARRLGISIKCICTKRR